MPVQIIHAKPSTEKRKRSHKICRQICTLRVQITVDVELTIPEAVHGDPMAKGLELLPHSWIVLLNPCLYFSLALDISRTIEPVAQSVLCCQQSSVVQRP